MSLSRLLFPFLTTLAACSALVGIESIEFRDTSPSSPESGASADSATLDATSIPGDASDAFDCDGATFCDSFERSEPLGAWDRVSADGGATLECTRARARSGSSSLRATLEGNDGSIAFLSKSFAAPRRLRWAFSMRIDVVPSRFVNVGALTFRDEAGSSSEFSVALASGEVQFNFRFSRAVRLDAVPLRAGRWIDVVVVVDLEASQFSLTVDGVARSVDAGLWSLGGPAWPTKPDSVSVSAGVPLAVGGPALSVHIDDVRIDLDP